MGREKQQALLKLIDHFEGTDEGTEYTAVGWNPVADTCAFANLIWRKGGHMKRLSI